MVAECRAEILEDWEADDAYLQQGEVLCSQQGSQQEGGSSSRSGANTAADLGDAATHSDARQCGQRKALESSCFDEPVNERRNRELRGSLAASWVSKCAQDLGVEPGTVVPVCFPEGEGAADLSSAMREIPEDHLKFHVAGQRRKRRDDGSSSGCRKGVHEMTAEELLAEYAGPRVETFDMPMRVCRSNEIFSAKDGRGGTVVSAGSFSDRLETLLREASAAEPTGVCMRRDSWSIRKRFLTKKRFVQDRYWLIFFGRLDFVSYDGD